jgi:uncharacterized protein (UPF0276 family)
MAPGLLADINNIYVTDMIHKPLVSHIASNTSTETVAYKE